MVLGAGDHCQAPCLQLPGNAAQIPRLVHRPIQPTIGGEDMGGGGDNYPLPLGGQFLSQGKHGGGFAPRSHQGSNAGLDAQQLGQRWMLHLHRPLFFVVISTV